VSQPYWRDGAPTQACVSAYTEGDCWILAIHLARQTNWTVYLLEDGEHWLVKNPEKDQYLDVHGLQTRSQVLTRWGAAMLRRASGTILSYATADVDQGTLEDFEGSHRRAPVTARRLIQKWL